MAGWIDLCMDAGPFLSFGGPMQDAVLGPLFCQTMMNRFLTLLGDPQSINF